MNAIYTTLNREVLIKLELNSSVKWFDGSDPTTLLEINTIGLLGFSDYGLHIIIDDLNKVHVIPNDGFVSLVSKWCPKKKMNIKPCSSCFYWEAKSEGSDYGNCFAEPKVVGRDAGDRQCRYFKEE